MDVIIKKVTIERWPAQHWYNPDDDTHVLFYDAGTGGAIMSGKTYIETERKFIQAMLLGDAIEKLLKYERTGKF